VGRGYQVTATLLAGSFQASQNYTTVPGKTVTFWRTDNYAGQVLPVAEQFATAVTDANGRATVTVPSLPVPGFSIVAARYTMGQSWYSSYPPVITWLPAGNNTATGPDVNITTPDTDITAGQGVDVTVTTVNGTGYPVPNIPVTVDVDGTATPEQIPRIGRWQAPRARVMQTYTFQSNAQSQVRLRFNSGSAGTSIITASYVIAGSVFSTSFRLTWAPSPGLGSISLLPRKQALPCGLAAQLIATVQDTTGAPLSNVTLTYGLQKLAELSHPYDLTIKDKGLQVSTEAADQTVCGGSPTSDANGRAVICIPSPKQPGDYLVGVGTRCQQNALAICNVLDYAFVRWVDEEDRHGHYGDKERHGEDDDEWEHRQYSHDHPTDDHRNEEEDSEEEWEHESYEHAGYEEERCGVVWSVFISLPESLTWCKTLRAWY